MFDIGTRVPEHGSPLTFLAYMGPNELAHEVPAGNTLETPNNYTLVLAIYGDNIRTQFEDVHVSLGPAPFNVHIS